MADGTRQAGEQPPEVTGEVVIRRLHRMVRQGYRPWLGYDAASGEDRNVLLRRRDNVATLTPNGTVTFAAPVQLPSSLATSPKSLADDVMIIDGGDEVLFDAAFPPGMPNRRNLVRRLYEIGIGAW